MNQFPLFEFMFSMSFYLAHTNPLFLSIEVLFSKEIFLHIVGLVMYKYSSHLLHECIAQLYMRNDSIHEHNTRECQLLVIPPGSETFSNLGARIWNAFSHTINCNV